MRQGAPPWPASALTEPWTSARTGGGRSQLRARAVPCLAGWTPARSQEMDHQRRPDAGLLRPPFARTTREARLAVASHGISRGPRTGPGLSGRADRVHRPTTPIGGTHVSTAVARRPERWSIGEVRPRVRRRRWLRCRRLYAERSLTVEDDRLPVRGPWRRFPPPPRSPRSRSADGQREGQHENPVPAQGIVNELARSGRG